MVNRSDLLSGTRPNIENRILITEKDFFEGYQVVDYKGLVWGISMRSKDVVQDVFMGFKQFVGGELSSYTELSDESRHKALDRLLSSAKRIGANAVINFRFEISSAFSGNAEVVAYGNAVRIEPIRNYVPLGGIGNIIAEFVDAYSTSKGLTNNDDSCKKISPLGTIIEKNGNKYLACPSCGAKHKITISDDGNIKVGNLEDVDDYEEGTQIHCLKCGTKFTIPDKQ